HWQIAWISNSSSEVRLTLKAKPPILISLFVRGEVARLATAGMAIGGFAFSAYLTSLELFEIHAICQWCVGSAIVMTAIAVLATIRALRIPGEDLHEAEDMPTPMRDPEGEPA